MQYNSANSHLYQQVPSSNAQAQNAAANDLHQHQKQRQEMLQQMRKHRSLDGPQFLREFEQQSRYPATHYPEYYQYEPLDATYKSAAPPPQPQPTFYSPQNAMNQHHVNQQQAYNYQDPLTINVPTSTTSYYPQQSRDRDSTNVQRELNALNQKLNYVMNSIRTFWSPELKKERALRKEEALRLNSLQNKICQQSAELQLIQSELEKREKDIGQLLSADSELLDMEEELRRLRRQIHEPRNYTEKSVTTHELQTLKTKMERSEMTLSEKMRELAAAEVRAKCAEEQNAELEKRVEILSRQNTAHEGTQTLLQDDLTVLRQKLEARNQQIDAREKSIKKLEQQVESMRNQYTDSSHAIQEGEHRTAQLTHRLDQLETLLREKEAEVDRLKQYQLQQPSVRLEADLRQQLENAEQDKRKLQESVDVIRNSAEMDKLQQLSTFQEENRKHLQTIENLQQELADREVLLASQNEKISQLDNQMKQGGIPAYREKSDYQKDLEETQKEVERLLRIMQVMEKEKHTLLAKINETDGNKDGNYGTLERDRNDIGYKNSDYTNLKRRVEELEEALRESVGITAERDNQIAEQKALILNLSGQLTEMLKEGGRERVLAMNNVMANKDFKNEIQNAMNDERVQYQRQINAIKKESLTAQIREKEATIKMLQMSPDQFADQISLLTRQKEQLRHKLLSVDSEILQMPGIPHVSQLQNSQLEAMILPQSAPIAQVKAGGPITASNQMWLNSAQNAFDTALRRVDFTNNYGPQQPEDNGDDDGIWA
uniref:GOLGA2L5 domain-containing protein n=1 Tax=Panagrellus redivivus TaxID=6233 RepID=A0A7E4W674_PANRE